MNYVKIHDDLISHCLKYNAKERLMMRDKNDSRLNASNIYTEKHHIIPKHDGGDDFDDNFVELLPEEHFLIHLIRYKAFKQRGDFLAVRYIINGYKNKRHLSEEIGNIPFNKRIGLFKNMIQNFRKETAWQTPEGRERISKARLNTFPCVDSETGESVGSHDKNHPNILSGKWVHHSKGNVVVIDKITNKKVKITTDERKKDPNRYGTLTADYSGSKNPNFKEMTDERKARLFGCIAQSIEDNHLKKKRFISSVKKEFSEFRIVGEPWVLNNFGSYQNLLDEYNLQNGTEYKYSPYHRAKSQRESSKLNGSKFKWYTNGITNVRVSEKDEEEFMKNNPMFYRGRTNVRN